MTARLSASTTATPSVSVNLTGILGAVEIRRLEFDEVKQVGRELNPDRNEQTHLTRLDLQDCDMADYLIAWHDRDPIAHALLLWDGPVGNPKQHLPVVCPYIEDLWVKPAYRSLGVGTAMVAKMECLAWQRGYDLVGLSVGIENREGSRFYRQLGYRTLGLPTFELTGVLETYDGEFKFWSEKCDYMRKDLSPDMARNGSRKYDDWQ